MALSNIRKEPRREITESAIGIFVVGAYVSLDYLLCRWVLGPSASAGAAGDIAQSSQHYSPPYWPLFAFLMLSIGIGGPVIGARLLYLTHAAGEIVCGWLKAFGADPRPRQRY